MAKYAISKEGSEALNQLANDLLINANNIIETNQKLEQITSSLYDNLGIYGDEIISIIHQNRNTLNVNREEIISLAQRVKQQAVDVDSLVVLGLGEITKTDNPNKSGMFGVLDKIFNHNDESFQGRYNDVNSIPQKEYELIEGYVNDGTNINSLIRSGKETKDIKKFRRCISEHIIPEDMTLYRKGSSLDFNNSDLTRCSLDGLIEKKVTFSGFMSTSPNKAVCESNNNQGYEFEFSVPKGTQGLDLSNLSYNEVIFNDKVEYIIENAYVVGNNTKHIVARIIGYGD